MTAPSMPQPTPAEPFPAPWQGGPTVFASAAPLPAPGHREPWTRPADVITVQTSGCCGAMPGDDCGCTRRAAEVLAAFARPLIWRTAHLFLPALPLTPGAVGITRDGAR